MANKRGKAATDTVEQKNEAQAVHEAPEKTAPAVEQAPPEDTERENAAPQDEPGDDSAPAPEDESGSEVVSENGNPAPAPEREPEKKPLLESLSALGDRHRVAAWQEAALCRYMGWEAGKMVSEAEYLEALNRLKARRIGGGRMG